MGQEEVEILARMRELEPDMLQRVLRRLMREILDISRDRELVKSLVVCMANEMFPSTHLEAWAETRLIKKDMKITPSQMAEEYAYVVTGSPRMAGKYVRDMQRVKHRLNTRYKRSGYLGRRQDQATVPRVCFKRTARQEAKRKELEANRKKRKTARAELSKYPDRNECLEPARTNEHKGHLQPITRSEKVTYDQHITGI